MDAPGGSSPGRLVILTGMSGAGKSTALRTFEDLGYYCIDNLPPTLIETFLKLYEQAAGRAPGVAVVCDIRSGELFASLRSAIEALRQHAYEPEVLFFDCADDELVARYSSARRVPPLGQTLRPLDAVRQERATLEPVRDLATHVIDTTDLKASQLRDRVGGLFASGAAADGLNVTLLTFGYKHGVPPDADFVFDARFLPNPFYNDDLRPLCGNDEPVRQFVLGQPLAGEFLGAVENTLQVALRNYGEVNKHFAVVALGCTGGRHRSVCLANELGTRLTAHGYACTVQHRDLGRD